jgi:RHS repeat-associated protein
MDTVRLSNYGESVAYAHTLIELNAGFETPTGATFETVLWGNPAYTISRTDYEYGASGLIATYQNGNVTAPTRYETNVGYFDFASNKRYYYLKDQLGNVRAVVDETANVISWSDYHAYGAIREQNSGASYDPYKFLTKEHDLETGTEHLDAREFDAWTGMFWQVEPKLDKYPHLGGYVYSQNNPIRFSDPDGEGPDPVTVAAVAGAAVVATAAVLTYAVVVETMKPGAGQRVIDGFVNTVERVAESLKAEGEQDDGKQAEQQTQIDSKKNETADPSQTDRIKEHTTKQDLDAARRESKGEVVARKKDGTPYDHQKEVADAQKGLKNEIGKIKKELGRPNLDAAK